MSEIRIPKIIHYCWFGGSRKSDDVEYCISTWKKILPDYQIMEWNEVNFPIENANVYVKEAYSEKKWAFVSDYARLYALSQYGGIYFDTDVEVFRSFDELLQNDAFFGFESNDYVTTAVMGFQKKSPLLREFLSEYDGRHFILEDGSLDTDTTNVVVLTRLLKRHGLQLNGKQQKLCGVVVFPQWYFSPNDFRNIFGKYKENNYSYHHCSASWYENGGKKGIPGKLRHYILGLARNAIGTANLYRMRHKGYQDPLADN